MNSKIVESVHLFRKKRETRIKEKDEENESSLFLSVFYFFPSWPTTFYLNSMGLKLEVLF